VFLADEKYFPVGHRGVYHTVGNNFFLNKRFMKRPHVLMSVMRHEGWHAAQDCMAGTIDNSLIAIIMNLRMMFLRCGKRWHGEHMRLCLLLFHGRKKQPGQVRLRV
jgi:hypothetical protein